MENALRGSGTTLRGDPHDARAIDLYEYCILPLTAELRRAAV
jgi:hypothetical protein